ncbi:MAG: isoleucine--tRNA ligase [Patescibacteria group bacterium]|jgi:isoleucyl-tRNA synthetase
MGEKSLQEREEEVLARWKKQHIFEQTLEKTKDGTPYVFFEGPPTANGKPHIGHVITRAYKDVIPRYKTMQGFFVERKAGWDTQGLPVELEVEKQIGVSGKQDIEKFGVEKFNAECRKSVWKYKEEWEQLTERVGFWLDMEHPYVTYENPYIESLWAIVKKIYDRGLFITGHKVLPYCPRCGTTLSDHEVAQGYEEVTEPAVYVKFKVEDEENTYILAWTTTPWTLPGNVALAVGEDIEYVKAKQGNDFYYLAKARLVALDGEYEVVEKLSGSDLVGKRYAPLVEGVNLKEKTGKDAYYVAAADFVTTADGTGVVHTAVMYGADDYALGEQLDLPKYHTVDERGFFTQDAGPFTGKRVKETDGEIIQWLDAHGKLYKQENYTHTYPFCWRCDTALLYYAKSSWFIAMSKVKKELLANNSQINWIPAHLKDGRFGEWLNNVVDWAISRSRYWGTPIPIWQCEKCGNQECIGSFSELAEKTGDSSIRADNVQFDPHKPFVDELAWKCGKCDGVMRRVPEVMDTWFDSGSMPFAQWHYPFENTERIEKGINFPADFICEAIDQTRGWFYTLLAVATAMGYKEPPFKNVISLGHVNDKHGKKMSKHIGNVVSPWDVIQESSADAVRWYFYIVNDPGEGKNMDPQAVQTVIKKTFLILDNVVKFYVLNKDSAVGSDEKHILDEWLIARTNALVIYVTKELDELNITRAVRAIDEYIQDLSTWYVRRSRDRFRAGNAAATQTLGMALGTLAKLMAPFAPFFAEHMYAAVGGEKDSVHLEDWPKGEKSDEELLTQMAAVRRIVVMGHAAREQAKMKVRQPLAQLAIAGVKLDEKMKGILAAEMNVQEVLVAPVPHGDDWVRVSEGEIHVGLDITLTDELKEFGWVREFTRAVNAERKKQQFTPEDTVHITYAGDDADAFFATYGKQIMETTRATAIKKGSEGDVEVKLGEMTVRFTLKKT